MAKKAQISFEYLTIMGFVTFILIGIIGIAFFYGASTQDRLRMTQVNNFGNKIVSTAESVFYAGEPSKATISVYLPENVKEIAIAENSIYISIQLSTGLNIISFLSEAPLYEGPENEFNINPGIKNLEIKVVQGEVVISHV